MLKAFSFIGLLITSNALACKLDPSREYISFSAPVTYLLQELDLLDDKSFKAVSSYHPVKNTDIAKLPGGIFLSPKKLSDKKNAVVFFDESRELKKSLQQAGIKQAVEVVTRGLDPFEANRKAMTAIAGFLSNCAQRVELLEKKINLIKSKVKKTNLKKKSYVFFLGKFAKSKRPPRLVIANDGFVTFLRKELKMKTYPSELAYVPPSSRILNKIENAIMIGIYDSSEKLSIEKVVEGKFNIGFPQVLSPGITQVFFLEALASSSFFKGIK
ncbi:MAG: hypothetical protein KC478_06105 [Bacteriovoracaceae bacterium]|nr:hypothetical protein [Bacteriovoracaceae bacterium]